MGDWAGVNYCRQFHRGTSSNHCSTQSMLNAIRSHCHVITTHDVKPQSYNFLKGKIEPGNFSSRFWANRADLRTEGTWWSLCSVPPEWDRAGLESWFRPQMWHSARTLTPLEPEVLMAFTSEDCADAKHSKVPGVELYTVNIWLVFLLEKLEVEGRMAK